MVLPSKLSVIVAGVASAVGLKAYLLRNRLPLPLMLAMGQTTAVGYCVALSCGHPKVARRTTRLLGKTDTGGFLWWSYPLFWPYHVGLASKLFFQQKTQSEDFFNAVGSKGWFIGGWPRTAQQMPPGNPAVLDCTCELPRRHSMPYLCLPTWDCQGPSPQLIEKGVSWATEQQRLGRAVLVHCAHGHGRSCTVLCAGLINEGSAKTIDEALAVVRRTRPLAKLNEPQRAALQQWMALREKRK